jgi:glucose/mannose-6-phosphate isomerase
MMQNYCAKHKIECRNIPQLHSPRASFPNFLYTILKVMGQVIPVRKEYILDSINQLEKSRKGISSENLTEKNSALRLAKWITGIPLIYYPFGLQAAAIRFKNSIQENAKIHAMIEDVIEVCHNGIVAWEKHGNVKPILLEGEDDYIKTKERWKILREYFDANKVEYWELFSVKGSILSKLINLIYVLDYASIYRAILSKVDPTPISSIDFIKSKLH